MISFDFSKQKPIQIGFLHDNGLLLFQRLNYGFFCRWDFCFHRASVVEHLDGHTEIIHMQLNNEWLPWSDFKLFICAT